MSNVIAIVIRGQYPYLEEHIAQKKAIYERYREGMKGLPVSMNPMLTSIVEIYGRVKLMNRFSERYHFAPEKSI